MGVQILRPKLGSSQTLQLQLSETDVLFWPLERYTDVCTCVRTRTHTRIDKCVCTRRHTHNLFLKKGNK